MPEDPIEELFVRLSADAGPLLKETKAAVGQTETELGKLKTDQAEGKFKRLATVAKASMETIKLAITSVIAVLGAMATGAVVAFQRAEQGLNALRIERSFRALAAGAGQASEDILAAMRKASAGTVSDLQLIAAATQALNFNIAKSPEQFARLTESALKLARIRGIPAAEALDRLIGGLGRREVELLDELGLNLVMINAELEKLAQARLGKSADDLSAVERESLFAEAALNAAAISAQRLGGSIEDVGSSLDQTKAAIENFTTDVDKAFLLATGKTLEIATAMNQSFFGPQGVFPLFGEGGNVIAQVFAGILANFLAVAGTMAEQVTRARDVFKGELGIGEFAAGLTPGGLAKQIGENTRTVFEQLKRDFPEILAPETVEAPAGTAPAPLAGVEDAVDEEAEKILDRLAQYDADLENLMNETAERRAELEKEHTEELLEIESDYIQKRFELGEKLADDLAALDKETAKERAQIINDARDELADIAADTDQQIQEQSAEFNEEERRQTEDHLKDMRRLREQYLFDLEGVVQSRDARAIVDLRRRFQQEQRTREEDFTTRQGRERQDQDQALAEIRENERRQAEEVIAAREQDLADLKEKESEKRQELQASFAEQLATLDQHRGEQLARENSRFAEEQAQLDQALSKKLEAIALELASERDMTEAGAQQILETLAKYYGEDGEIDKLMAAFRQRMSGRIEVEVDFQRRGSVPASTTGGSSMVDIGAATARGFAAGGSMIANSPTLVRFGEAGPELAQFTPLSQVTSKTLDTKRIEGDIGVHFTGVPSHIDQAAMEEAAAGVMVQAIREAGLRR